VKMGFVSWFYVKAKSFKVLVAGGAFVLHFVEMSLGFSCVVFLGKLCAAWLKSTVEVVVCNPEAIEFIKLFREGSKAFIVLPSDWVGA